MFTIKEIYHILLAIIIMGIVISFTLELSTFLLALLFSLIIIGVNIISKKITAFYYDTGIEHSIWKWSRWGLYERSYFKKPIPLGFFLPLLLSIISLGTIKLFTFLQFTPSPAKYKVAKRHGLYRFSELVEGHIAIIAYVGIITNLVLAVIAYLINVPDLARFSIYYAGFNLLPISQLDGNKIFFGSLTSWFVIAIITGLFLVYAFFLI